MNRRFLYAPLGALALLGAASMVSPYGRTALNVIGNVFLQDTSPGIAQVGHANIKGTFRAGQVFVQQGSAVTIPIVGNNISVSPNTVGASFSAAGQDGIGAKGTATNVSGAGIGLLGDSRSFAGFGVKGVNDGGGTGVWGSGSPGVLAESPGGIALQAESTGSFDPV